MSKPKPIKERIADAMAGRSSMEYWELLRLVFPEDQFPKARNYQANGGPPGCAMAFGKALREMGYLALSGGGRGTRMVTRSKMQAALEKADHKKGEKRFNDRATGAHMDFVVRTNT